jgi:hypothetical protein
MPPLMPLTPLIRHADAGHFAFDAATPPPLHYDYFATPLRYYYLLPLSPPAIVFSPPFTPATLPPPPLPDIFDDAATLSLTLSVIRLRHCRC